MTFVVETLTAPQSAPLQTRKHVSSDRLRIPSWITAKFANLSQQDNQPLVLFETKSDYGYRVFKAKLISGPAALSAELDDVNRFLVARAEGLGPYKKASFSTVEKLACNLRHFLEWLEETWYPNSCSHHYLDFSAGDRKRRPTYAYREHLINSTTLSPSTKNVRMSTVRMFYEDLERRGILEEVDRQRYQRRSSRTIRSHTSVGRTIEMAVSSSDLMIPHARRGTNPCLRDTVVDDGIVRPLDDPELDVVTKALNEIDNPSLRLASYLALNSGARLQTVLTLRRCHARQLSETIEQGLLFHALPVGGSSLSQTKRGTPYWLVVPTHKNRMLVGVCDSVGRSVSIAQLLANYEASDTAKDRYQKVKAIRAQNHADLDDELDEYLFLGRNGLPFYLHHDDPLNLLRKSPRNGQSFKRSMANTFARKVAAIARQDEVESLSGVKIGFHDFRGTFAERSLIAGIEVGISRGLNKNRAEAAALRATQRLLGHRRIESTERYLKFREYKHVLLSANESYCRSLLKATK